MRRFQTAFAVALMGTTGLVSVRADAQVPGAAPASEEPSAEQTGDIVVTAQRREERLQDVPIAVSAITSAGLARNNITDVTDIGIAVPSLKVTNNNGYIAPRLRGIGSTATGPGVENSIAVYVDGVYFGSTAASLLSLVNIERVEVLKGPQGTLFGRNATGGLIQIVTRTPTQEPQAELNVSYGNYQTVQTNAYVAGGLAPNLAMDVAVQYAHQGKGWGTNLGTGNPTYKVEHDFAARSKIVFDPGTETTITLAGDYADSKNSLNTPSILPGTRAFPNGPLATYPGRYDTNTNRDAFIRGWQAGVALTVRQGLGAVDLTSITAYRQSRYRRAFDLDLTTNPQPNPRPTIPYRYFDLPQPDKQFSQEVQLTSAGAGGFTWLIGGYYYAADSGYDPATITFDAPFGPVAPQGQRVEVTSTIKTRSIAGFAQGTLALGAATNLTLGGRYTHETKSITGSQARFLIPSEAPAPIGPITPPPELTANRFSFRASLDHHFGEDILAYASANRGFKSGGFVAASPNDRGYNPEQLDAYEIGLKTQLFDRRVTLNLAAFYYDYTDIQIQTVTAVGTVTINGPSATIKGLDVDANVRVSRDFTISGGLQLVDDRFGRYEGALISAPLGGVDQVLGSATENRLPLASRATFSISPQYTIRLSGRGTIDLSGAYSYNSGWFPESDNVIKQPSFSLINASARWNVGDGLSLGVFGRNLSDVRTFGTQVTVPGGRHFTIWTPPRTYGVTLGTKF